MKLIRKNNRILKYKLNEGKQSTVMQNFKLSNFVGPITLKEWLEEIEEQNRNGGWRSVEELDAWEEKMTVRMIQAAKRKKDPELLSLVEEYLDVYQNSGYYDYGAEEELGILLEKIELLLKKNSVK